MNELNQFGPNISKKPAEEKEIKVMCKKNKVTWKKTAKLLSVFTGIFCLAANQNMFAAACPVGATDIGPGSSAGARVLVNGVPQIIGAAGVGACNTVRLGGTIRYDAQGTFGVNVAFEGGTMRIFSVDALGVQIPVASGGIDMDVTPNGVVPTIGPPECSTIQSLNSTQIDFDIASHLSLRGADGIIRFRFLYGPAGTKAFTDPPQFNVVTKGDGIQVLVTLPPTCSIQPATVCAGQTASLTATATGDANGQPYSVTWTGPNGFSFTESGVTSSTISIPNAQAVNAGTYSATFTDAFGCPSQPCTGVLTVNAVNCSTTPGENCASQAGDIRTASSTVTASTLTFPPLAGTPVTETYTYVWKRAGVALVEGAKYTGTATATLTVHDLALTDAGTDYSVLVTGNTTRCEHECPATIIVDRNPVCSIANSPVGSPAGTYAPGTAVTLTVTITPGDGTPHWKWFKNNVDLVQNDALSINVVAPLNGTDSYRVDVEDTKTCKTTCATTVTGTCVPTLQVLKTVTCKVPGVTCADATGYAETATGVRADPESTGNVGCDNNNPNCPAFCFRFVVNNTGSCDLENISVKDDGVEIGTIASLPAGGSATIYVQRTLCASHVDTATASGTVVGSSTTVNAAPDTAEAIVKPISIHCDILLHASIAADITCANHLSIPAEFSGALADGYRLAIQNTGQAAVNVTAITHAGVALENCRIVTTVAGLCTDFTPVGAVTFPILLAKDATVYVVCDIPTFNCQTLPNFDTTVSAEAVASSDASCIWNSCGNIIKTKDTTCSASITCVSAPTCRVTGGGQLIPGFVDNSCIPVETTIFPFTSANGLTIKKITHGGQLGAPFSQMDCGQILGNPCIRGQWQHTRHYEGQANPRDVIDMDFHSNTPKGVYDTLSCACLGCCDPVTGAFIPPKQGPLIHKFQLCNPDDHKVCGPQPRPAPANVIIFTGIGTLKPTSDSGVDTKKSEYVIFRVYIEDRSEPGGGHPGGAVEPADIYCFQAWRTAVPPGKKPDFSGVANSFRLALGEASCKFLKDLEAGTLSIGSLPSPTVAGMTADFQDCGPMHDGNHQIHPSTGATCTE